MPSLLLRRVNDALRTNFSSADKQLTNGGSNWLWAVFAFFTTAFLAWLVWSLILKAPGHVSKRKTGAHADTAVTGTSTTGTTTGHNNAGLSSGGIGPERIFHYLWIVAAFAGMVAYFAMASNLGNTPIRQYLKNGGNPLQTRQVFYARYIYWVIAWPMVIIATLLLSGVSWATILFAVAMQELWVISWLCGALVTTKYKWGFYVFGIMAYFVLSAVLLAWARKHSVSNALRSHTKHYTPIAGALVAVWAMYIIAWGLSEGSNRLGVTGEHIFYGILDIISVPLLGTAFLFLSKSWDHQGLGLHYTSHGRVHDHHNNGFGQGGGYYNEKSALGGHGHGINNNTTTTGTTGVLGHDHANNGVTGHGLTGNGVTGNGVGHHHDGTTTTHPTTGLSGTHPTTTHGHQTAV